LAPLRLRDRDAILTEEGLIFRVYGYTHPPKAYVCNPEYAPATIYRSTDPRALRKKERQTYYKFYANEGLRFVQKKYPQYTVFHEPLQKRLVGVHQAHIAKTRRPHRKLQQLIAKQPRDDLLKALHKLFDLVATRSGLSKKDFGVFGSLLHGFYHPQLSDIDLTIYGRKNLARLSETLKELYREGKPLQNEFEGEEAIKGKGWRFVNYGPKEYLWHQKRKGIYAVFMDQKSRRAIKTEFEPVKDWKEIRNEYSQGVRITQRGWIKAVARVTDEYDAPFMPSIYQIELIKLLEGERVEDVQKVLSYVEEFRMQAKRGEEVYVEGNLELMTTPTKTFHQITLTHCPRYYEQTLKVLKG